MKATETTYFELATRLGWKRSSGRPDDIRVKRSLGLAYCTSSQRGRLYRYKNHRISIRNAVKILRAVHLDPVDFGL